MKIDVRNIKIAHTLSEETYAYTATVYVDGARAFDASNHGTGGCDFYRPVKGYTGPTESEINAWLATNTPAIDCSDIGGGSLTNSLELVVGDALTAHVREQDAKRIRKAFDRILAKSITGIRDGKLVTFKAPPTPAYLDAVRAKNPALVIVNNAPPTVYEQGLRAYCPDLAA